jgi:tRNA-dihydrouridine synthase 4
MDLLQAESAGVTFITVHGRTPQQRCEPVDYEAIKNVCQSMQVPIVANGDICSRNDAQRIYDICGVNGIRNLLSNLVYCLGVMAARGMLQNPAMFLADEECVAPIECIRDWVQFIVEIFIN